MKTPGLGLLALALLGLRADPADDGPATATSHLTRLDAADDLGCALDFRTGDGPPILGNELVLDQMQLVYHRFSPDRLAFGFVVDQPAAVMDLGEWTVPADTSPLDDSLRLDVSVFHSLTRRGSRFEVLDARGRTRALDAAPVLGTLPSGVGTIRPEIGHTYLMRYRMRGDGGTIRAVKFLVVDHAPGRYVTLRWAEI